MQGRVDSHARQAGRKRKALLELLDQVENIVHTRGVPSATQKSSLVLAPVSMADQSAVPALMLSPRKDSQPVVLTEIAVLADEECVSYPFRHFIISSLDWCANILSHYEQWPCSILMQKVYFPSRR